jgi:predicted pyridoxine 5'-phosphate oxidase superfamily flavin-nucleotide-binding protein
MTSGFHDGERAVQARVGMSFPGRIRDVIPPIAAQFAAPREFCVVSGLGDDRRVWTTMLAGPPGFVRADGEHALRVRALPHRGDPLATVLTGGGPAGLLLYDDHRRKRVNGTARAVGDGLVIDADQVFSNCGRYISDRRGIAIDRLPVEATAGRELSWGQRDLVRGSDTFFIGSRHPDGSADCSHRGGNPGFVRIDAADRLSWPDYDGNNMFMTLGNITLDPRVGLLFLDWTRGTLLQVSGRATIDWSPAAAAELPGAQRVVRLQIDAVRETVHGVPMTWSAAVPSRFNPPQPDLTPAGL